MGSDDGYTLCGAYIQFKGTYMLEVNGFGAGGGI